MKAKRRTTHKRGKVYVGSKRVVWKRAGPKPQPEFHPITGQRVDQPLPPITRVEYRYLKRPKLWVPGYRRKVPMHKYIINIPQVEWEALCKISLNLSMPVSLIMRLAARRFVRAYKMHEVLDRKGRVAGVMTTRRLFTRAEREVLNQRSEGGSWMPRVENEERMLLTEKQKQQLLEELGAAAPKHKNPVPENFKAITAQRTMRVRMRRAREAEAEAAARRLIEAQARERGEAPPPPPAAKRALSPQGRRLFIVPKKP